MDREREWPLIENYLQGKTGIKTMENKVLPRVHTAVKTFIYVYEIVLLLCRKEIVTI